MIPDEEWRDSREPELREEGVEVPLDRLAPDTLRNLIAEFVTREWGESGERHDTLDDKIRQVERQLQERKAKVVFDLITETCNIIPANGIRR